MRRRVKAPCGSDLLIAIFDDPNNRGRPLLQRGGRPDASTRCASEAVPIIVESRLARVSLFECHPLISWC